MKRSNKLGWMTTVAAALIMGCQTEPMSPTDLGPSLAIINHGDGSYFVGKGDVQTFFGWNNQALQRNATYIDFQYSLGETTTWTCTRTWVTGPENNQTEHEVIHERNNSTTTQGLFTTLGRDISDGLNGPNTGFVLTQDGDPTTVTDGPAVGTCPADPSGFVYDNNAQTISTGSGLQIILLTGAPGPSPTPTGKVINTWYNFP
jgi:hypothetical protein